MMPCLSERTRKRRAFADTELDAVMMERERFVVNEAHKMKAPAPPPFHLLDPARSRQLLGQLGPREFLQRIFPTANPNVLELVYQGCGGSLEKTIEQLVSNNVVSQMQAAHFAQQQALLHQQGKVINASQQKQSQQSAFVRPATNASSPSSPIRPPPAHTGLPVPPYPSLAAFHPLLTPGRLPYPFVLPGGVTKLPSSSLAAAAHVTKELLEEKSAFQPKTQDSIQDAQTNSPTPSPSLSRSPSPPVPSQPTTKNNSPIKFSVASIIGESDS